MDAPDFGPARDLTGQGGTRAHVSSNAQTIDYERLRANQGHLETNFEKTELAPAVGFEPTTNRLTADRSTTELRWITQLKKTRVGIFAHDPLEATTNPLISPRIDAYGVAATIL